MLEREETVTVQRAGIPLTYRTSRDLLKCPIVAGVTNRHGGISQGAYSSLNMGLHVGDDPEAVLENRKRLARFMEVEVLHFVQGEQVHGLEVAIVEEEQRGCGALSHSTAIRGCDALVTSVVELPMIVFVADCMPLIIYDQRAHVGAVVHGGWRGVYGELPKKTIILMKEHFGTAVDDLIVYGGPHIGFQSFEVDSSLAADFVNRFGASVLHEETGRKVSLGQAVRVSLEGIGLRPEQVTISTVDTFVDRDYFSYRREEGLTGRFCAFIKLLKKA